MQQVIDCETRQLLLTCDTNNGFTFKSIAALPAGRMAAGDGDLGGIDVLALEMAGSELAPAGDACQPSRADEIMHVSDDELRVCATGLNTAGPDNKALSWHVASRVASYSCPGACLQQQKRRRHLCRRLGVQHHAHWNVCHLWCSVLSCMCAGGRTGRLRWSTPSRAIAWWRWVAGRDRFHHHGQINIGDLAAGGRVLCRATDLM